MDGGRILIIGLWMLILLSLIDDKKLYTVKSKKNWVI